MSTSLAILINSLGIIAVAVMIVWMSRRYRQLSDELVEMQAVIDLILVEHGKRPVFAPRYDLDLERIADDEPEH